MLRSATLAALMICYLSLSSYGKSTFQAEPPQQKKGFLQSQIIAADKNLNGFLEDHELEGDLRTLVHGGWRSAAVVDVAGDPPLPVGFPSVDV